MDVQKEIAHLMKKHNLSREGIADKLGVTSMTIWRWEKGLVKPKSRLVIKAIEELKKKYEA